MALHFTLRYPDRVRALVVLGATRGIHDLSDREERRRSDEALADRIESIGADAFLDEWLARKMFASLPKDPLERAARSTDAAGLANSLRFAGTGTQRWLAPELASLEVPTLALAGALDQKFSLEATAIAEGAADASAQFVPDAHHAAHLEQAEATAALVQGAWESASPETDISSRRDRPGPFVCVGVDISAPCTGHDLGRTQVISRFWVPYHDEVPVLVCRFRPATEPPAGVLANCPCQ